MKVLRRCQEVLVRLPITRWFETADQKRRCGFDSWQRIFYGRVGWAVVGGRAREQHFIFELIFGLKMKYARQSAKKIIFRPKIRLWANSPLSFEFFFLVFFYLSDATALG